jgi:biopolymer transport protein TolR
MGMSAGGDDQGMMAEINVTPFVDVMLVLLIIFMVTTPMIVLENQLNTIDVDVPDAEAEALTEITEDHLVIAINEGGAVFLAEREVPIEELEAKLSSMVEDQPDKQVFLKADGSVAYANVAQVMAICSRAGIEDLGMITEPEGD